MGKRRKCGYASSTDRAIHERFLDVWYRENGILYLFHLRYSSTLIMLYLSQSSSIQPDRYCGRLQIPAPTRYLC